MDGRFLIVGDEICKMTVSYGFNLFYTCTFQKLIELI